MTSTSIVLDIIGRDKASKAFSTAGTAAEGAGNKAGKFGKVAAAGLAAAGAAAIAFGKNSMDKFASVSRETMGLQRGLGGTAEEASRMRYAAEQSGVGFDVLSKSIGLMSKHSAVGDKAMKAAGVSFRDATGKMRPTKDVMNDLADKFKSMPNGPLKTALAMKVFGKSGAAMLPMLSKGSAGMKALGKESDELGNTISGKDTAAVKANIIAKRKWTAAISGVQIMLGRKLFPAMLKVSTTLAAVSVWVNKNSRVMGPLVKIVLGLVGAAFVLVKVTKAYTAVQAALNVVMAMNPIGLVVLAIVGLVAALVIAYKKSETFRNIVNGAFSAVKKGAVAVWSWVKSNWPLLLAILMGPFGIAVVLIAKNWDKIKVGAAAVVAWFKGLPAKVTGALSGLWDGIVHKWTAMRTTLGSRVTSLVSFVTGLPGRVRNALSAIWNIITDRWSSMRTSLSARVSALVSFVADMPSRVWRGLSRIWNIITDKWADMKASLTNRISSFITMLAGLPARVGRSVKNLFGGLWTSFKGSLNKIITAWNNLSFTIGGATIFGKTLPSVTIGTPNMPHLAKGGIVTRPTLAVIGEAGPEAVVPLSRGRGRLDDDRPIIVQLIVDGAMLHQVLVKRKRTLGRELGLT